MRRILLLSLVALSVLCGMAENVNIADLKVGEEGLETNGCSLVQHNGGDTDYANMYFNSEYVIQFVGKRECLNKEDGSDEACYFVLSLNDGTFKGGDVLTITGARNIKADRAASLYFEFSNGTTIEDSNVWNNYGILTEMTFGGDAGGIGGSTLAKRNDAGTQPIIIYSMYPSTFDFIVPAEADGAEYVKITRNISETPLYISSIIVKRDEATGIKSVTAAKNDGIVRNLQGIQVGKNYRGVVIKDGRKVIQ